MRATHTNSPVPYLKLRFLSSELTFLSSELTFLSSELTFLSPVPDHGLELRNVSLELRNVSSVLRNVSFKSVFGSPVPDQLQGRQRSVSAQGQECLRRQPAHPPMHPPNSHAPYGFLQSAHVVITEEHPCKHSYIPCTVWVFYCRIDWWLLRNTHAPSEIPCTVWVFPVGPPAQHQHQHSCNHHHMFCPWGVCVIHVGGCRSQVSAPADVPSMQKEILAHGSIGASSAYKGIYYTLYETIQYISLCRLCCRNVSLELRNVSCR